MINQTSDNAQTASGPRRAKSGAEEIGRRLGLICYFLFLIYVLSAGAISILGQVYGNVSTSAVRLSAQEAQCASELRVLEREIIHQAGPKQGSISESRPPWTATWDQRFKALGQHCGKYEPTRIDLRSLRDRLESTLLVFNREQSRLVKRIERELDN